MSEPVTVNVISTGNMSGHFVSVLIFDTRRKANAAYRLLVAAVEKYDARENDRKRFIEVNPASGPFTLDVSDVKSVSVEDMNVAGHLVAARNARVVEINPAAFATRAEPTP